MGFMGFMNVHGFEARFKVQGSRFGATVNPNL